MKDRLLQNEERDGLQGGNATVLAVFGTSGWGDTLLCLLLLPLLLLLPVEWKRQEGGPLVSGLYL